MATSTLKKITPTDIGAVAKTGDTMTGTLQMASGIRFLSDGIPTISYDSADGLTSNAQLLYIANGSGEDGRFKFREFRPNGTDFEDYNLPMPNASGDSTPYEILTTKFAITVQQGGTGATTPDGACASIGAVKKSGDTMTGTLAVNRTSDGGEADVEARSAAGNIYLYSAGINTGDRGIYAFNAAGTGKDVITIDQNNNIICNGNAVNVTGTVQVDHGGTGAATADVARTNLGIHSGSLVASFDNGTATLPFSTFGLNSRPYTFVATMSNADGLIRYDWDLSTSNIVLVAVHPDGTPITATLRLSWIAIPYTT